MTTVDDSLTFRRAPDLGRVTRLAAIVGGGALVLALLVGVIGGWRYFFQGYLVGYMLFVGLTLGCLALAMLNSVTGGRWGEVIRPIVVAGAKAVPLMALLFIPILLNLQANYPWARPYAKEDEILHHQQAWNNPLFFAGRAVFYFLVWTGLAFAMAGWSRKRDRNLDPALTGERTPGVARISGPGILLFGVTVTFAVIDWVMSIEPRWISTIMGLHAIASSALTALAFGTLVLAIFSGYLTWPPRPTGNGGLHETGRVDSTLITTGDAAHAPAGAGTPTAAATRRGSFVAPADFGDLGNLMLAFTMLWAYMSISQYLIIWAGNLPFEVQYYVPRVRTGWRWVGLILIVCHFAVPFFSLFGRNFKRNGRTLGMLAAWILLMRLVDWIWVIQPSVLYHNVTDIKTGGVSLENVRLGWWVLQVLLLPAAIGGLWVAFFAWQVGGKLVLPVAPPADPHGHGDHGAHHGDAAHAGHGHGHSTTTATEGGPAHA